MAKQHDGMQVLYIICILCVFISMCKSYILHKFELYFSAAAWAEPETEKPFRVCRMSRKKNKGFCVTRQHGDISIL